MPRWSRIAAPYHCPSRWITQESRTLATGSTRQKDIFIPPIALGRLPSVRSPSKEPDHDASSLQRCRLLGCCQGRAGEARLARAFCQNGGGEGWLAHGN